MPNNHNEIVGFEYLKKRFNEVLAERQSKALLLSQSALDGESPTYEKQILAHFESLTNTTLDASSILLFQVIQGLIYQMTDSLLQVVAESNRYILDNIGQER